MGISLKAARVNAKLTQKEASKKLGVSVSTIVSWEKEPEKVSALMQKKIEETYGIPIDKIIFLPED